MIKTVILIGVGFVIACVVAVKYGPWFKKTSTEVDSRVEGLEQQIKDRASSHESTNS